MKQDGLIRQFKPVDVGVGMQLKKELSSVDLGEVQLNDGTVIAGEELLKGHLEAEEY